MHVVFADWAFGGLFEPLRQTVIVVQVQTGQAYYALVFLKVAVADCAKVVLTPFFVLFVDEVRNFLA